MKRSDVAEEIQKAFSKRDWYITPIGGERLGPFAHFADLYDFIEEQRQEWQKFQSGKLAEVFASWHGCLQQMSSIIANPQLAENFLQKLAPTLLKGKWPIVLKDSGLGILIRNDGSFQNNEYLEGFLCSLDSQRQATFNNPMIIKGLIDGYNFERPGRFSERMETISAGLESSFRDIQAKQIGVAANLSATTDLLEKEYGEHKERLETVFSEKKDQTQQWIDETRKQFEESNQQRTERFSDLINVYERKLQLEAPAKYWANRASNLRNWGLVWAGCSITTIVIGSLLLWNVFISFDHTAELMKEAVEASTVSDADIKSTLLTYFSSARNLKSMTAFAVIVSGFLFILRTFIKLTLSAFHLSLDAREREQLTYVYLSLIHKGQQDGSELIKEKEREIILQSLFSRADSGLLKGDSGPTMPGDLGSLIKHLGAK